MRKQNRYFSCRFLNHYQFMTVYDTVNNPKVFSTGCDNRSTLPEIKNMIRTFPFLLFYNEMYRGKNNILLPALKLKS